jgi:hypothetical protein
VRRRRRDTARIRDYRAVLDGRSVCPSHHTRVEGAAREHTRDGRPTWPDEPLFVGPSEVPHAASTPISTHKAAPDPRSHRRPAIPGRYAIMGRCSVAGSSPPRRWHRSA